MRRAVLALILATIPALHAGDPWTHADTARELTYVGLTTLDWGTTLDIQADNAAGRFRYEQNPLLGRHPSRAKINALIPASMALHYLVARLLPERWRAAFQYVSIGAEITAVSHNYAVGLRLDF